MVSYVFEVFPYDPFPKLQHTRNALNAMFLPREYDMFALHQSLQNDEPSIRLYTKKKHAHQLFIYLASLPQISVTYLQYASTSHDSAPACSERSPFVICLRCLQKLEWVLLPQMSETLPVSDTLSEEFWFRRDPALMEGRWSPHHSKVASNGRRNFSDEFNVGNYATPILLKIIFPPWKHLQIICIHTPPVFCVYHARFLVPTRTVSAGLPAAACSKSSSE